MNIKNGTLSLSGSTMDYIRFGTGSRTLIILPGLGDGLRTVKGTALPMAVMYRSFSDAYTAYGFSRRNDLPQDFSTRDMARDVADAMTMLGISRADVFGVSMGGMIAQHLAADYPERVGRLVLAVTAGRPSPEIRSCIPLWVEQARQGDHTALMDSNLRYIYSDAYYRKNRHLIPVMGKLTKPASYDRFLVMAQACMDHNAWDVLPVIAAPTLVIGGGEDRALGSEGSRELSHRIHRAEIHLYPHGTHALYEEEGDFNRRCLDFLTAPLA